jgi:hypothetical protein
MFKLFLDLSSSIWTVLASSYILIHCAFTVKDNVRLRGRIPIASTAIKINSRLYSIASLCFCLAIIFCSDIVSENLRLWFCGDRDGARGDEIQRQLYHFSKLYEYLDIFLVLANGGSVGLHFAFHHLTVSPRVPPNMSSDR